MSLITVGQSSRARTTQLNQQLNKMMRRVEEIACQWGVAIERTLETQSSVVAFGKRGDLPVVIKVIRKPGDEWRSGEVLEAFNGCS